MTQHNFPEPQPKFTDLSRQTFGLLYVIEQASVFKHAISPECVAWLCSCTCGEKLVIEHSRLIEQTCCGCTNGLYKPSTGTRFGRLTVLCRTIGLGRDNGKYGAFDLCLCDCGGRKIIRRSHLRNKSSTSCGCYVGPNDLRLKKNALLKLVSGEF